MEEFLENLVKLLTKFNKGVIVGRFPREIGSRKKSNRNFGSISEKKTLKRWIAEKIFGVFHKGAPEKVYTVTLCLAPGWIPKQILSQTPFLQEENNSLCGLCGAR